MIVTNASREALEEIAAALELRIDWQSYGGGFGFALRPKGTRYAVTLEAEDDAPETAVVCWHGQEAFIARALMLPGARVKTPLATYKGMGHFRAIQRKVRERYLERYGEDPCSCE